MGMESVTLYTCERNPQHQQYIKDGDKAARQWDTVEHINADGTVEKRLACPSCLSEWAEVADRHDREFKAFWNNGGE